MEIITKYKHQTLDELKSYTVHLIDSVCTCTEDGTESAVSLEWNGEFVSGDLPNDVLNGVSDLISNTIQNATAAGLLFG